MNDIETIERRIEMLEFATFGVSEARWHSTSEQNGFLIGRLGSLCYIVDPLTERAISRGYHEISISTLGNALGSTGNTEVFFAIPLEAKITTE